MAQLTVALPSTHAVVGNTSMATLARGVGFSLTYIARAIPIATQALLAISK